MNLYFNMSEIELVILYTYTANGVTQSDVFDCSVTEIVDLKDFCNSFMIKFENRMKRFIPEIQVQVVSPFNTNTTGQNM